MGTNRKLMKKMVALLLGAVVLASSLAGCGAAPQTQPEVPSVAAETESATPAAETAATETAAETNAEPVEIELFVNHPWWTLREWKGSVPEEITRKTGVKFKITVTADDKQLPLLIASGDLDRKSVV